MSHAVPEFEQIDAQGKTQHFNGGATTTLVPIPAVAGGQISRFLIKNLTSNSVNRILYISMDGGTTFFSLTRGEFLEWYPRKNNSNMPITQLFLKSDSSTTNFESLLDFDP